MWETQPLFAEEGIPGSTIVAGLVALLTAGSTVVLGIIAARHKNRQDREATAITQWREYADQIDEQLARANGRIDKQMDELAKARVAELAARAEAGELRAYSLVAYSWIQRATALIRRNNLELDGPPGPPPVGNIPRATTVEAGFTLAAQQHETGLLLREAEELIEKPSPPRP